MTRTLFFDSPFLLGFDHTVAMIERATKAQPDSYPPYNVEALSEQAWRITVAVAGFGENELSLESRENTLTIKGSKELPRADGDVRSEVLYQGIAARAFERRFQLADHVQVTGASLENGLLHVDLVREIPEAQKPRSIPIGKANSPRIVESKAA